MADSNDDRLAWVQWNMKNLQVKKLKQPILSTFATDDGTGNGILTGNKIPTNDLGEPLSVAIVKYVLEDDQAEEYIRELTAEGCDLSQTDIAEKRTPLSWAIASDRQDLARVILPLCTMGTLKSADRLGNTALMYCAMRGPAAMPVCTRLVLELVNNEWAMHALSQRHRLHMVACMNKQLQEHMYGSRNVHWANFFAVYKCASRWRHFMYDQRTHSSESRLRNRHSRQLDVNLQIQQRKLASPTVPKSGKSGGSVKKDIKNGSHTHKMPFVGALLGGHLQIANVHNVGRCFFAKS